MQFFLPDSNDTVDPTFDFVRESRSPDRLPRDDLYAHEFMERPYDGILVSYGMIQTGGYSAPSRRRLMRTGLREFYRAPKWLSFMGDCGAFNYVRAEEPPYTVAEVAEFYATVGVDLGIAVDHIVPGYADIDGLFGPADEVRRRYDLCLALARDFWAESEAYDYVPVGAVHGWSPSSYASAAEQLQRMGYRYLAIGGLVPLRTDQLMRVLAAVASVRRPDTRLHLLGMARRGMHASFAEHGVVSIDSTSPLRQAWMDKTKNYHLGTETFAALRIPDSNSPRVRKRIASGDVDHGELLTLEAEAMCAVAVYAAREQMIGPTLDALMRYQALHSPGDDRRDDYVVTLEGRPWERCRCSVCRTIGHHVVIFRGAERNRRRGFHNVWQFYRGMLREMGEPDLVLVGCGLAKRDVAPARDLYTGSAFRASMTIAERYRAPVRILSALHGVIKPDVVIERYDATLNGAPQGVRRAWCERVEDQLRDELPTGGRVVALAGADYLGWSVPGVEVDAPLAGKTLGQRMAMAAGTDIEPPRPVRSGEPISWDFFWTTHRSSLKGSAFVEHWQREGARHARLDLPDDTSLSEALQAAREAGLFGKGTSKTGVFEVQNDRGIYWAPDGYLNLGQANPRRVRFISWDEAERREAQGHDHIECPPEFTPC